MRSNDIFSSRSDTRKSYSEYNAHRLQILNRLVAISFHPIWQWLIEVVIVLSIFNAIYVTLFNPYADMVLFYYCLEAVFLYDTFIAYIHRFRVRKFTLNPPRHVVILLIDTLSLLPVYECCYIAYPQSATRTLQNRQQLKSLLRMVHLVASLFLERFHSIKMHIALLKVTHVFLQLLMNLLLACWWSYQGRCWPNCKSPNWTDSLQHLTELQLDQPLIWFLTCFTTMGDVLIHGSPGFLIDHNDAEAFITLAAMIIGFTMHSFFEVAHTFNNYIDVIQPRYDYQYQIRRLHLLFDSCPNDSRKRTLQYYGMLWRKRRGIVLTDDLVQELPMILVKEIMVDVYHESLIHSHLFTALPYSLKKELCLCMRTEYFLPGDYLYVPGQTYAHMVYVHSGVINVISHEDSLTPVLALTAGTLLGEKSLCMGHVSKARMQCATECEVKLLPMASYNRLALRYHASFAYAHDEIKMRIQIARRHLQSMSREMRAKHTGTGAGCKRLKKQWRCVAALHAHEVKHASITTEMWSELDKGFYSKYLDSIALADRLLANRRIICLNAKCPYVMHPESSFRKFFVYLHLAVVVIHTLILPYYYVFIQDSTPAQALIIANLIMDIIFFFDIYLQLITFVVVDGVEIVEPRQIVQYKLKEIRFLVDIISVFPYEYFGFFGEGSDDAPYLVLRLPKLIQWYKIVELVMTLEANSTKLPYLLIIIKYFIIYFTTLYLSTCYHYMMFNFGQHGPHPGTPNTPIAKDPILYCIYYNLSAICLLGLSERMPISMHGMLMYSLLTFIGCYLLNFCIVEISCNIVKNNEAKNRHLKHLKKVDDFLISNSLIFQYKEFLHNYFNFLWQYNKNITLRPDPAMPEYDIYLKNIIRLLRQVPAFVDFSDKLLELIAAKAHVRVHPPGYELSSVDDRNIHLHIIAKGYCTMALFMPGDREKNIIKTLKPGDCFNILEVLHSLNSFNTIKTLTAVEELSIRGTDIWDVLDTDKTEMSFFREALKWHANKYETILNVNKLSDFLIPPKLPPNRTKHVTFFKYSVDDDYDFDRGDSKKKKLRKQLGILYYYLMKDTIDPQNKFFIAWEIFRSTIAISFGFMTLFNPTILVNFYLVRNVSYLCTVILFAIDAYIRLHLQYYNEENVRVTYIHNTMEHYIKTSMTLDIIAMTPIVVWPFYIADFYSFSLNMVLSATYYIALFHRPVQGLIYFEENFSGTRRLLATALRNTIIVCVVVGTVANNMLLAVCSYNAPSGYTCNSTVNYISTSPFLNNTSTLNLLIFHLHAVSERIHSDIVGVSEYPLMDNIHESLVVNMFLWCFKLYLMSKMIASTIGTNAIMRSKAKSQFHNFILFIKYEIISEEIAEEVKEHFDYVNTKHEGTAINELLWKFPDKVRLDLKKHLFTQTLHMTQFFHAFTTTALRVFYDDFDMRYYKIGAEIIRCNDVQGNIYVVSKGAVDIIVAADTLITLTRGGAFGCFNENGITRQTILARSTVHVELLVIASDTFYKHLAPYPSLIDKFRIQMQRNMEYFEPTKVSAQEVLMRNTQLKLGAAMACYRCYDKFNKYIRLTSKSYKRYEQAVVHVAALTSIISIVVSFTRRYSIIVAYCYICDIFFWAHIIIKFHMQYIDPETGISITSPKLIRKRYAKSLAFWVTLLGTLPIELIPMIMNADRFVIACFFSNRWLRFALPMIYNHELNKKLSYNTWFQWLYIVYLMMFQIGFMSLIWWQLACHSERCMHRVGHGPIKEMGYSDNRNEILLSILYVVILFTAAGVRTVSSVTIAQISVTIFISTASLIITSTMIGVLASLLFIKHITSNRYKNKVKRVKLYFDSLHLSPCLRSRIYQSMVILWMLRRGELMPRITLEAPDYIRQNVMMSMYSMHLTEHKLFGKMHKDMLRQVCTLFKVGLYAPDQVIVSTGDRDGCMYFLHRGQIRVTDETSDDSVVVSQVYAFGEEQGVYDMGHRRTYTAYSIIDLLLLEKNVWEYLLEWYPAAQEIITSGFQEYCPTEDVNENSSLAELNVID